ncbi:MAG TPA: glycosyltransferase family 1 protein [Saprospiraceae bacterium]|nr:glycosyltransferase family 1 protein [Saprospiraceae bacterium]HMQ81361.1 glycosyltransferase family 1 protein [Saprospiraceae bacterium]
MLRIGYDAKRLFNNFTGLGNYSRTLLANLAEYDPENAYFLYTPRITKNEETHFFFNSALFNVQRPRYKQLGTWWRSSGVNSDLVKHRINLYHGLSNEIPFGIKKTGIKSLVTVHDLIFKRFPDYYPWLDRQLYDYKCQYACQYADHIVAISESTKRDIIEFYQVPPEKITVIYQSCHERYMQEKAQKTLDALIRRYHLPEDYLLSVGSITERKNLLNIIKAMEILPATVRLPLVVVGKGSGRYLEQVNSYLGSSGLSDQVYFIDVLFEDLPALYQNASIFIYPSQFEGFGIPILEAMFSEIPVITSNVSSLPEAAGPGGYLVNPDSPEEIALGIERILGDETLREQMVSKGLEYAQRFRGEPLSKQMLGLYRRVLGV